MAIVVCLAHDLIPFYLVWLLFSVRSLSSSYSWLFIYIILFVRKLIGTWCENYIYYLLICYFVIRTDSHRITYSSFFNYLMVGETLQPLGTFAKLTLRPCLVRENGIGIGIGGRNWSWTLQFQFLRLVGSLELDEFRTQFHGIGFQCKILSVNFLWKSE